MPDVEVQGLLLHWEEHVPERTSGRPVVLLHGLGSSGEDWLLQTPVLAGRRRVLAPDLPGHGRSQGLRGWPRVEDFGAVLSTWLAKVQAAPAHLVGLSLGGALALQLAIGSPERVASLVVVNSLARFRPSLGVIASGAVWLAYALTGRMERVASWVAADLFPDPDQASLRDEAAARLSRNRRLPYLQAMAAAARFNAWSRLGSVACPTLVIAGELDTLFPVDQQREMAKAIPGARMVIVPRSRHATPIDAADRFNQIVVGFLEEVEGSGRWLVVGGQ